MIVFLERIIVFEMTEKKIVTGSLQRTIVNVLFEEHENLSCDGVPDEDPLGFTFVLYFLLFPIIFVFSLTTRISVYFLSI